MDSGLEEREFVRIPVKVDAQVTAVSNGEQRSGKTEDVSMKGFFVECAEPFVTGTQCRVDLLIGGPESDAKVCVKVKVAYASELGMGAQILSHLSLESYGHLYRLVLYNAADKADLVEAEIEKNREKMSME